MSTIRSETSATSSAGQGGPHRTRTVWEYLDRFRPEITARTKVIERSDDFGFPPLVCRRAGDPGLRRRMTEAFLAMERDEEGRQLLKELMLDRFVEARDSLYDDVQRLAGMAQAGPPAGR